MNNNNSSERHKKALAEIGLWCIVIAVTVIVGISTGSPMAAIAAGFAAGVLASLTLKGN